MQHYKPPKETNGIESLEKLVLLYESLKESKLDSSIRGFSSFNDQRGTLDGPYHGDKIRCFAVIADPIDFGIRINSIPALWHANRLVRIIYGLVEVKFTKFQCVLQHELRRIARLVYSLGSQFSQ